MYLQPDRLWWLLPQRIPVFQPIAALAIGAGYYFRSSGVWTFDIVNDKDLIPLGVGFGKVFKVHNVIVNASIEPQVTVYHNGTGQPSFQLFSGLYLLFPKEELRQERFIGSLKCALELERHWS
jgi:hypothetical protein